MADRLAVALNGATAGHLEPAGRRSARFVPSPDGPTLTVATSGSEAWTADLTRAWFEGLLPEGDTRIRLASRFRVRPDDWFGLLAEIGWECAGAVSVVAESGAIPEPGYQPLTDQEVGERLDTLPGRPLDPDGALRVSLGGAQDKLVLARRGSGWSLPLGGAPSTHILKPQPPQWPGAVAAEAWALALARTVTEAAEAQAIPALGTRPVLVVTRFDRHVTATGEIRRVHQEDLCQALGLPPDDKYHEPPFRPGKPSFARLAAILRTRGVDPVVEIEHLLARLVVTLAVGNADAHAKNWSLLHDGSGLVRLAPLYDVVPTLAFVPGQRFAGLPIAGRFRLSEIGVPQILAEASDWGVPDGVARRIVRTTLDGLRDAIDGVAGPDLPEDVRRAVHDRVTMLSEDATS